MNGRQVSLLLVATACLGGCQDRSAPRTAKAPGAQETAQSMSSRKAAEDSAIADIDTMFVDTLAEESEMDAYVDSIFKSQVHESPRMGWFLPGRFLAKEKHPRLQIFSADSALTEARFARILTAREHEQIKHKDHLACTSTGALAEYTLSSVPDARLSRALFISQPFSAPVRAGLRRVPLSAAVLRTARALLDSAPRSARFADTALMVAGGTEFYSIHAAYNPSTREIAQSALVLHDSTGRIVASSVTTYDEDHMCDGCGMPKLEDGFDSVYDVLNGFVIPGFPHPVLLVDTSTIEGRALSFLTFNPQGAERNFRIYEYVVACILDAGLTP